MPVNIEITAFDLAALLGAFIVAVCAGPGVINWLRVLKFGQNINTDAPERHLQKQGTPTMGGVLLALTVTVILLIGMLWQRVFSPALIAVYLVFLAHAVLGFLDDYLSAKRGKSLGLKAREKIAGQLLITFCFTFWLSMTSEPHFTTVIQLWRGVSVDLGIGYYVLVFLWMIGISNAVNLTDGLDGLAGGLSVLTSLGLAWTVFVNHPGFGELPWFGYALAGACVGFLWFNAHPAKVFMGDTGSLALGASFAAMAIIGKQEVLLLLLCAVFLVEMFSVIIQVSVFKATGGKPNGRRVFRMTPIHHHFELIGWAETQVVARFWIAGALATALALLAAPYLSPWILPR